MTFDLFQELKKRVNLKRDLYAFFQFAKKGKPLGQPFAFFEL